MSLDDAIRREKARLAKEKEQRELEQATREAAESSSRMELALRINTELVEPFLVVANNRQGRKLLKKSKYDAPHWDAGGFKIYPNGSWTYSPYVEDRLPFEVNSSSVVTGEGYGMAGGEHSFREAEQNIVSYMIRNGLA
jgi:hypothetical protein